MKIYSRNDGTARKVLAEVKRWAALSKDDSILCVESYANCREQGFALASCDDRKVVFSENRSSDDIVVYTGNRMTFEFNSNVPNEEVWESRKYFKPDQIEKAAKFILKFLES